MGRRGLDRLVQAWSCGSVSMGPARGPVMPPVRTTARSGRVTGAKMSAMDPRDLIDDLAGGARRRQLHPARASALRRRLFGWPRRRGDPMAGRTVVAHRPDVGPRARGGRLARALGARVVLVGPRRRAPRADLGASSLAETPGLARDPVVADMGSLASVRAAVGADPRRASRGSTSSSTTPARCSPSREVTPGRHRGDVRDDGRGPVRAGRAACCRSSSRARTRGSSPSPRAACTRRRCRSTTSSRARRRTPARAPTPGRSGPRSRSCASGRAGCAGTGVVATRCTPAGPTRRASPPRCRASTGSSAVAAERGRGRRHDRLARGRPRSARAATGRLFLDRRPRPFDRIPSTRLSAADRRRSGTRSSG